MKRLFSMFLAILLVFLIIGTASASTLESFQPFTQVDLGVFKSAGWKTSVDEWKFTAEIYPTVSKLEWKDVGTSSYSKTSYTISMDLKIVYSAGHCNVIPRFIFNRDGSKPYYDGAMSYVYIRVGENRYSVRTSGGSRSTNSKNYSATDNSVEPMYINGAALLQDIAESDLPVSLIMGSYADTLTMDASQRQAVKDFYNTCKKAGVFDQLAVALLSDDYSIITLFNQNSPNVTETGEEETVPDDNTGE